MTARFLTALEFVDEDGLPYVLLAPLVYDSATLGRTITVPAGFRTDLASIPRALWALWPKSGKYDRAAVVHDAAYQWGGLTPDPRPRDVLSRGEADAVLREAMVVLGVGRFTRTMIWLGVRTGGFAAWGRYRRQAAPSTAA